MIARYDSQDQYLMTHHNPKFPKCHEPSFTLLMYNEKLNILSYFTPSLHIHVDLLI